MKGIYLVHDVLDAQLLGLRQEKMGRVDGLVIELRDDAPPRVAELLIGGSILAERIGRWMESLVRVGSRLLGIKPVVTRIPFEAVRVMGACEVDVDAESTTALRSERWLDEHVVCRIPGGAGSEKK